MIGITTNGPAKKAYDVYIFNLRTKAAARRVAEKNSDSKAAYRNSVALANVRTDLIALRGEKYQLSDDEWLEKAGFSPRGNCYLRDDSQITLDLMAESGDQTVPPVAIKAKNFEIHLNMFLIGGLISVGSGLSSLEKWVLRLDKDHKSLPATTYLLAGNKDHQIKSYISKKHWTCAWDFRSTWATNPRLDSSYAQKEIDNWLEKHRRPASDHFLAAFNAIKVNDDKQIT